MKINETEIRKLLKRKSRLSETQFIDRAKQILDKELQASIDSTSAVDKEIPDESAKNIYQLIGADRLFIANEISRKVSTHLGFAWEKIAALSHLALSPDFELGEKIQGVDVVVLYQETLIYTQLKSQRNTLTGSQKGRSIEELRRFPHAWFAVAFPVGSWTFPRIDDIPRFAGPDFWSKLNINYKTLLSVAKERLLEFENKMFDGR